MYYTYCGISKINHSLIPPSLLPPPRSCTHAQLSIVPRQDSMGDTRAARPASSLPVQACVPSTDAPLTLLKWAPRPTSPVLRTASEEQARNGTEKVQGGASVLIQAGEGVGGTGAQEQQVSPAIMSLAQQMLQMQAPLGPHLCDFVVGAPMGAVLRPTLKQVIMILLISLSSFEFGLVLSWPNAFSTQLSSDNSTLLNHQLHFTPWEMDMVGSLSFAGKTTSVFLGGWLTGSFGRRLSNIYGCFPLILGWFFIIFAYNNTLILVGSGGEVENRLFPVFCFIGIAFANAAGMSSLPLLIAVEYFPTSIRAQGLSVCLLWLTFITIAALQLYSTMVEVLTLAGLYWHYALFSAAAILHVMFFIRETNQQDIG
ncbi:uncharacterized protein LOC135112775 [Scylla paramamosain]|uniref:uncharacterized protein LOC135112775 n=1 Tax=Scylla paramamosain TaxID=85552 RepID=UPI00308311DD